MPPRPLLCWFLIPVSMAGSGATAAARARSWKGFPFFGFYRPSTGGGQSSKPLLASVFPCKGGQVGALGKYIISLVSFFVIASKKFQARNLCFAFRLWCPPNGGLGYHNSLRSCDNIRSRFARPIFNFFFINQKKKI